MGVHRLTYALRQWRAFAMAGLLLTTGLVQAQHDASHAHHDYTVFCQQIGGLDMASLPKPPTSHRDLLHTTHTLDTTAADVTSRPCTGTHQRAPPRIAD